MTIASALPGRRVVYRTPRQTTPTQDHEPVELGHEIQLEEAASRPVQRTVSDDERLNEEDNAIQREDQESNKQKSQRQMKTDDELASSGEADENSHSNEDCKSR